MGFRGRQDHYDPFVEDFSIFQMADESKVVEFKENPTKTRQGGLRNPTRRSPQQMWSTDGGERDRAEEIRSVVPDDSSQTNK